MKYDSCYRGNICSYLGLFLDCFRHSWKQFFSSHICMVFSSSEGKLMDSGTGSTMVSGAIHNIKRLGIDIFFNHFISHWCEVLIELFLSFPLHPHSHTTWNQIVHCNWIEEVKYVFCSLTYTNNVHYSYTEIDSGSSDNSLYCHFFIYNKTDLWNQPHSA